MFKLFNLLIPSPIILISSQALRKLQSVCIQTKNVCAIFTRNIGSWKNSFMPSALTYNAPPKKICLLKRKDFSNYFKILNFCDHTSVCLKEPRKFIIGKSHETGICCLTDKARLRPVIKILKELDKQSPPPESDVPINRKMQQLEGDCSLSVLEIPKPVNVKRNRGHSTISLAKFEPSYEIPQKNIPSISQVKSSDFESQIKNQTHQINPEEAKDMIKNSVKIHNQDKSHSKKSKSIDKKVPVEKFIPNIQITRPIIFNESDTHKMIGIEEHQECFPKKKQELQGKDVREPDIPWIKQQLSSKQKQKNKEDFWNAVEKTWSLPSANIINTNVSTTTESSQVNTELENYRLSVKYPRSIKPIVINNVFSLFDLVKQVKNYESPLYCIAPVDNTPIKSIHDKSLIKKTKTKPVKDLMLNKKYKNIENRRYSCDSILYNSQLYELQRHLWRLPKTTPEGYRMVMYSVRDNDPTKMVFAECVKTFLMFNDIVLSEDGIEEGYIVLFDMKGVQLGHLARVSLPALRCFFLYIQEAHPVKIKGVHVLNTAGWVHHIMRIIMPMVKSELLSLVKFHKGNHPEEIPLELMPNEYGGETSSVEELDKSSESLWNKYHTWLLDNEKIKSDETKRSTKKSSWWSWSPFGSKTNEELDEKSIMKNLRYE